MATSIKEPNQPTTDLNRDLVKARDNGPQLIRGVGLRSATTLNMIDMIGVGPFITIPAIIAAMNGPQAMLGWIFGVGLVMFDGLVLV